jgi:hypothetical protein
VYNKRAEVIAHKKSYWWDIWNHTLLTSKATENGPALADMEALSPDPSFDADNRVWRIRFRADKNLLNEIHRQQLSGSHIAADARHSSMALTVWSVCSHKSHWRGSYQYGFGNAISLDGIS